MTQRNADWLRAMRFWPSRSWSSWNKSEDWFYIASICGDLRHRLACLADEMILNGKVAGDPMVRSAIGALRESGRAVEVRVTWELGDAQRFTAEASADQFDLVIAGGGDGTVNEVVHGLMDLPPERRPVFGIVPLGTANDFANGCGIPADPKKAFELCANGRATVIDVGKANDRYFINAASGGFGATLTAATPPELKRLLGGAAYTLMGAILAAKFKPYSGRLILPDRVFRREHCRDRGQWPTGRGRKTCRAPGLP